MHRNFMVNFVILCALSTAAYAQSPAASPRSPLPPRHGAQQVSGTSTGTATAANPSSVGLDQAVITLKGGCQPIADLQPAKDCVHSVTREQFEKLANAMQPDMPAETKRTFAINYGKLLAFFDAAQALHLEDDPAMQQIIQFVTKQVIADGVKRHYAEQFAHPSDAQIQAYYTENSAKYVEASLQRIVIPRKPTSDDKTSTSDAADGSSAEKVRQRWVAGENPTELQKAAFEAAGVTGAGSPDVNLGTRLSGSLPADQESVFRLKAGEVSPVYSDPAAFYIYRVTSVREIPLSEVKDSIVLTLQRQQLQDKLEEIGKSAVPELNDQYFGTQAPPAVPATGAQPTPAAKSASTPPK